MPQSMVRLSAGRMEFSQEVGEFFLSRFVSGVCEVLKVGVYVLEAIADHRLHICLLLCIVYCDGFLMFNKLKFSD